MVIIRISQAKSINHTEFKLMPDYKPVPLINFELAKDWAGKGLLDPFSSSFVMLIENLQNYFKALRDLNGIKGSVTHREVDEYVAQLRNRGPAAPLDAVVRS